MREVGLYVGKKTAMAATARGECLRRRLNGGPLSWLVATFAVIAGAVPEGTPDVNPDVRDWCRGLLRGLGYDPDTHLVSKKVSSKGTSVLIRDHVGEPVRALSQKVLAKLQTDKQFLAGFVQEQGQ